MGPKEPLMPSRSRTKASKPPVDKPSWENKRTDETRRIEEIFSETYPNTEAYRFNSASIRIRIVDERFEEMPTIQREDLVWPMLDRLPKKTRDDISLLLLLAPSELNEINRHTLVNQEFEHPRPSKL
jgi:stress-induced morphogen